LRSARETLWQRDPLLVLDTLPIRFAELTRDSLCALRIVLTHGSLREGAPAPQCERSADAMRL
jgi:hypothetical protein